MYRINQLLKLKNELYHTSDLSYIWGIKNSNTLYTTIKRYVKIDVEKMSEEQLKDFIDKHKNKIENIGKRSSNFAKRNTKTIERHDKVIERSVKSKKD